jgi:hypothetical protein
MFKVSRRPSFPLQTPYGKDPILFETAEYLKKLRDGDESAIEPVVLGHTRLAVKVASGYVRPEIKDEIASVAILALVEGCHKVINGHDCNGNLTGYLLSVVHSRCYRFFCEDRIVSVPMCQLKKQKQILNQANIGVEICRAPKTKTRNRVYDLKETILHCCNNSREKQIISLRQYGFNNFDIAMIFGMSHQNVSKILKNIEKRFNKETENETENDKL